jgi:hypothetical protein
MLAAACGIACLAQETPAPEQKAEGTRAVRAQRLRGERQHRMMRGMRGGIDKKPFGKLANGKEATI